METAPYICGTYLESRDSGKLMMLSFGIRTFDNKGTVEKGPYGLPLV